MNKNKVVLLVDDDMILCQLTAEMLSIVDIKAFTANSLEDAVKVYTENHELITLIIFDMNLEDSSGLEVYEKLKEIDENFVSVLASGMIIEEDKKEYLDLGFDEIVAKPYSMLDLHSMIDKYLN